MLDDDRPIYLQIADHVADAVLSGDLQAGERVMSTNEYAAFFRINPATAAKGINLLVDDGILFKRRGVGMFVAEDASERLAARRRATVLTDEVDALVRQARLAGIAVDELVERIRAVDADHAGRADDEHRSTSTADRAATTTPTLQGSPR